MSYLEKLMQVQLAMHGAFFFYVVMRDAVDRKRRG